MAEDFPCQPGLDFGNAAFVQESGLAVGAVADHVDVGMMGLVVEGGVPAELAQRYLHGLRELRRVAGEQLFPVGGVVVAQAGGDAADVVLPVGVRAGLVWFEIGAFENEPWHEASPPCGQHREGPGSGSSPVSWKSML